MKKNIFLTLLFIWSAPSFAAVTWDWSFGDEYGTFITDGTSHDAGTFNLIDFTVTSSSIGGAAGSLLGGEYASGGALATAWPYSFIYDGAKVTDWLHSGSNDFDWWVFQNNDIHAEYFFGWGQLCDDECYEVNEPSTAGINLMANTVTVTPSAVPVPAAAWLFGSGLLGLIGVARRKKAA